MRDRTGRIWRRGASEEFYSYVLYRIVVEEVSLSRWKSLQSVIKAIFIKPHNRCTFPVVGIERNWLNARDLLIDPANTMTILCMLKEVLVHRPPSAPDSSVTWNGSWSQSSVDDDQGSASRAISSFVWHFHANCQFISLPHVAFAAAKYDICSICVLFRVIR